MANFPYMVSPLPKGKTVHRPFTKSIAPDYFGNWKFCIAKYGKDEKLVRPTDIVKSRYSKFRVIVKGPIYIHFMFLFLFRFFSPSKFKLDI